MAASLTDSCKSDEAKPSLASSVQFTPNSTILDKISAFDLSKT